MKSVLEATDRALVATAFGFFVNPGLTAGYPKRFFLRSGIMAVNSWLTSAWPFGLTFG